MKNFFLSLFLFATAFLSEAQTLIEKHLTVDNIDRLYLLYTPSGLQKDKTYPLIIVLHGGGGQAKRMPEFTGFNKVADREKFLVLYPDGFDKSWNDGRIAPEVKANSSNVDDVKFIKSALEQASTSSGVDAKRVFVTGISNGAMMSLYLAYKMSDQIRAVAPVCGSIPENLENQYTIAEPVSLLIINGTHDKLVPYEGGPVLRKRANRGSVISTAEMINLWKSFTNKSGAPLVKALPDIDPRDRCTADRLIYPSSDKISLEMIRVNNGGHTWPGGSQYLPRMIVGNVCRDFKAEEVIWEFFKAQSPR